MVRIAYGLRPLGFNGFTSQTDSEETADTLGEGTDAD